MSHENLIKKLRHEQYETSDPAHSPIDVAWRKGWNARAEALIFDLSQGNVEAGLRELRDNAPVPPSAGMSGVVQFDLSDGEAD